MKELLNKLQASKSGASAAEYALIIALVAVAIIVAFGNLGTAIDKQVNAVATDINAAKK